ncbi:MAG: serine hydrolase [Alteromonadaceae bacterium]|nr:serine hydrolase [Alteromonadaceae bacterium]
MRRIYLLLLLLCTFSSPAFAKVDAGIDELVTSYQEYSGFSGTLLVVENDEVILSRAVGYADDAALKPIAMNTRFDIGSIQKNLTAVLVLQAVDRKLLQLNDTLDAFALEFKDPRTENITIQQLLEHRSGFSDIFTAEYRENPSRYNSIDKKLALLSEQALLFTPGTDRRYSNYGYIVLGAVLEKVTGKSYWELVEQNLLQPSREALEGAQMDAEESDLAEPYHFNFEGKRIAVTANKVEHRSPDGGGEMSILELYAFYHQLFNANQFLSKIGLQTFKSMQDNQQQWLAFGGGRGISTAVELDFDNDIWVLVLANTDRLVAEKLSSRVRSYFVTGEYNNVSIPPEVFTYRFYQRKGEEFFSNEFQSVYQKVGYKTFIGKTVTNLARELIASQKAEESIFFFRYLTTLYPDAAEVYDGLAFGYFSSGDAAKARDSFEKARKLKPNYESQFNSSNYEVESD